MHINCSKFKKLHLTMYESINIIYSNPNAYARYNLLHALRFEFFFAL